MPSLQSAVWVTFRAQCGTAQQCNCPTEQEYQDDQGQLTTAADWRFAAAPGTEASFSWRPDQWSVPSPIRINYDRCYCGTDSALGIHIPLYTMQSQRRNLSLCHRSNLTPTVHARVSGPDDSPLQTLRAGPCSSGALTENLNVPISRTLLPEFLHCRRAVIECPAGDPRRARYVRT